MKKLLLASLLGLSSIGTSFAVPVFTLLSIINNSDTIVRISSESKGYLNYPDIPPMVPFTSIAFSNSVSNFSSGTNITDIVTVSDAATNQKICSVTIYLNNAITEADKYVYVQNGSSSMASNSNSKYYCASKFNLVTKNIPYLSYTVVDYMPSSTAYLTITISK